MFTAIVSAGCHSGTTAAVGCTTETDAESGVTKEICICRGSRCNDPRKDGEQKAGSVAAKSSYYPMVSIAAAVAISSLI